MTIKDDRYMELYIPEGIYSKIRVTMETRWRLDKAQAP